MKTSPEIEKIFQALSKFQGSITAPPRNKTVTIQPRDKQPYSFQYAELNSILEHVKKPFAENGLSWCSTIEYTDTAAFLITRLCHISGQWIETEYRLPNTSDAKAFAGEITYGRRYSFNALTGIASELDADEIPPPDKKANNPPPASRPRGPVVAPKSTPPAVATENAPGEWKASKEHLENLKALGKEKSWKGEDLTSYMKLRFAKDKLSLFTLQEYNEFCTVIKTLSAKDATMAWEKFVEAEKLRKEEPNWGEGMGTRVGGES